MLQCNIGNIKVADTVRDNLSRSWDYVLVPVTLRSLLTANNRHLLIFKACHTLATKWCRGDEAWAAGARSSARRWRVGDGGKMAAMHYSSQ
jgi:hypothetical protein